MFELGIQLRRAFIPRLALGVIILAIAAVVIIMQLDDETHTKTCLPAEVIEWRGRSGKGFRELNCGGDYIFGTSTSPYVLDVWKWNGTALSRTTEQKLPDNAIDVNWIDAGLIANYWNEDHSGHVELKSVETGVIRKTWTHPSGWYTTLIQTSANGQYVGLTWGEEAGEYAPKGADSRHARTRIGVIGPERRDINWAANLVGEDESYNSLVSTVLPSNNGTYVAIAGYGNMLAMVDVAGKKHLWTKRPPREVSLTLAAFSPDSSIVYTGGASAAVYAMDVKSGKLLDKWYASPTGKEEYGHRLSSLAVSPDGKWIAAGTGPQGLIFVGSTEQAKVAVTLDHGGSTISLVHFSPDSKALASVGSGTIKIWPTGLWNSSGKSTATSAPTEKKSLATSRPGG